jgi:hypothetical protein
VYYKTNTTCAASGAEKLTLPISNGNHDISCYRLRYKSIYIDKIGEGKQSKRQRKPTQYALDPTTCKQRQIKDTSLSKNNWRYRRIEHCFYVEVVTDITQLNVKTHSRTTHKTKRIPPTNGWTRVLAKDQQFLLLIRHLQYYSYIQSSLVKVLAVIEDRTNFHWK